MKSRSIRWAWHMAPTWKSALTMLMGKQKERDTCETHVYWRLIEMYLNLSGPGWGLVGCCEPGNDSLGFIKYGEIHD